MTCFLLAPARASAGPSADAQLEKAYAAKAAGQLGEAARAFRSAAALGASEQRVDLELAYLAASEGDLTRARELYEAARSGSDDSIRQLAETELAAMASQAPPAPAAPAAAPAAPAEAPPPAPPAWLDLAYRAKAAGNLQAAYQAFRSAQATGASPQLVAIELGYLANQTGDPDAARTFFSTAEHGPDRDMSDTARRERNSLPRHFYSDLYADTFAWNRVGGQSNGDSVVPTVRLRAFARPVLSLPIEGYVSAQATRDSTSHGFIGARLPQVYSDNYATFGGGVRVQLWSKRISLFGQAGPALNLLDDGKDRVALDIRGGVQAYAETAGCAPAVEHGVRAHFWPCADFYGDAMYIHRFRDDVISTVRPRASAGWLMTGPVLWQAVAEAHAGIDSNSDYWNNLAEGGGGHRWRLLAPFRLDFIASVDAGSYFGWSSRDPAPSKLSYVDVRGVASTYVEF